MAFITIPTSKKHKSLLDYDSLSDLDSISNGPDGNNTRNEGPSEDDADEESDSNDDGEDDEPMQSQLTKMLTPPPTTYRKWKHRNKICN